MPKLRKRPGMSYMEDHEFDNNVHAIVVDVDSGGIHGWKDIDVAIAQIESYDGWPVVEYRDSVDGVNETSGNPVNLAAVKAALITRKTVKGL